jgi:hypothetical protein
MAAPVPEAVKPQLYAQAGVPQYLQIELDEAGPHACVYRLQRDCYAQVACVEQGQPLTLTALIAVTLDLAALPAATRPSS